MIEICFFGIWILGQWELDVFLKFIILMLLLVIDGCSSQEEWLFSNECRMCLNFNFLNSFPCLEILQLLF